jgi:DNA-binding transcriptional LysR family regulator
MLGLSIRQLQVFVAVAGAGSVSAAAAQLHMTQPAASMALAELERLLGGPLFDRTRGRLALNPRGRERLAQARELVARMEAFGQPVGVQGALVGELAIGASNTVGNYLAGELLGAFVAAHPQVAIRLAVGNTDDIAAGVLAHRFELGCVEGPVSDPQLDVIPWRRDELVVCTRPDHPLARRKRLLPAHFAGARWVLRERGSATRALSERALARLPAGITVLELDQTEAIKQVVIAGLGIACLPRAAIGDAVAAGRLVALRTPFLALERMLAIVLPRAGYRSAVLAALLATLTPVIPVIPAQAGTQGGGDGFSR